MQEVHFRWPLKRLILIRNVTRYARSLRTSPQAETEGTGPGGELASLEKAKKDQRTHPAGYYVPKSHPKVGEG